MFAAASVLGTLISAGLLAWMAGEATPPGFEEKLRREAGSLAAAVEADPANTQWLERLLDPEMRLTTFAHVMANTVPDEETRKAISSEGYADPNAPVLVLDSAQLARRSLIDKLIFDEAGDVAGTDVEIAEIFVVRGGLPFRAAFSGSE
ncbi:MAG TPA: hypothetical protein VMV18_04505, partial [bacterium]|nr:hypothetical protein [bacterium]